MLGGLRLFLLFVDSEDWFPDSTSRVVFRDDEDDNISDSCPVSIALFVI